MEKRLYFLIGDLLGNGAVGGLSGWGAVMVAGHFTHHLAVMALGMGAGMVVALVAMFPLLLLLGAFEVMLPVMLAGMSAGMMVGMAAALGLVNQLSGALLGVVFGIVALCYTYLVNGIARGEA